MTKDRNLERCDSLLHVAECLERDLHDLARLMPPGVSNTAKYLHETGECAKVVVMRLNTAYNSIRRYDHD